MARTRTKGGRGGTKVGPAQRKGGRKSLSYRDAHAIASRFREFKNEEKLGTYVQVAERSGVNDKTLQAWMTGSAPAAPDVATLVGFARKTNVNLNWLLLGEASMFRDQSVSTSDLTAELRAYLERRCEVNSLPGAIVSVDADEVLLAAEKGVRAGLESLRASFGFLADAVLARGRVGLKGRQAAQAATHGIFRMLSRLGPQMGVQFLVFGLDPSWKSAARIPPVKLSTPK